MNTKKFKKIALITGGAGFIGANTASKFYKNGYGIVILDNLSRRGSEENLKWLKDIGVDFCPCKSSVDNFAEVARCFERFKDKIKVVIHLAAQVAVTTSVIDPRKDFEINAQGTFNICEAVRLFTPKAALIYASTNKVYGEMKDVKVRQLKKRYVYKNLPFGISESRCLDFHSPYGCSKGSGDQYIIDYARIFNLKSVSFRQSCIYGERQFGVEDQGWIAWFVIRAVLNKPITIYGDGKQVRDVLYIDDLVNLYLKSVGKIEKIKGQAFNIGGGPENILSLLELIELLEQRIGRKIKYKFSNWRPGDQKVYISDIRKIKKYLGWKPKIKPEEGVEKLLSWVTRNREMFRRF